MRKKHNLLIGDRTAEDIKIKIGSAYPRPEDDFLDVRGRNLVTGLPKTVRVSSEETEEALREPTSQIIEAIHSVLENTPPELAADIADRGIVLTGGGEIEPRSFSFNNPFGACPDCAGLGYKMEFDEDLMIPDKTLSINDGCIVVMGRPLPWLMLLRL